ncbi:MAG: ShlB/FhaC/HecB family hemolysin secretion/activation protein [Pseudomonadota bacterium]
MTKNNNKRQERLLFTSLAALALPVIGFTPVYAQDLPPGADPTTINEALRRRQEALEPQRRAPSGPVINAKPLVFDPLNDTGATFLLNGVTFDESAFLTQRELAAIAAPYLGKTVSFSDLNALLAEVNALYDAGGYLTARAVLAPQRIEGGIIKVTLVEGVIEDVILDGNQYYSTGFITNRLRLEEGAPVDLPELERQLLRFNRMSNAAVIADLQPGDAFGTTDITLKVQEPRRNQLDVFVDNNGFDSTGEWEIGAVGRRFSTLMTDDLVSGFISAAEGALAGSVAYSIPVGRRGARFGVSYAGGQTEVVNGPFADLSVEGNSSTFAANASLPLFVGRTFSLNLGGNVSQANAQTSVDGVDTSDTDATIGELSVNGDIIRGKTMALFRVSGLIADTEEKLFDDTRDVTVFRGNAALFRQFTPRTRATIDMQWQHTEDMDLPGILEFQVGGANSVRAFAPGTLAGDSGLTTRFQVDQDLRIGTQNDVAVFAFYDFGQVDVAFPPIERNTSGEAMNPPDLTDGTGELSVENLAISAAGVGFRMNRTDRATLSGSVAVPLDDADLPEAADVRAFVNLSVRFW